MYKFMYMIARRQTVTSADNIDPSGSATETVESGPEHNAQHRSITGLARLVAQQCG